MSIPSKDLLTSDCLGFESNERLAPSFWYNSQFIWATDIVISKYQLRSVSTRASYRPEGASSTRIQPKSSEKIRIGYGLLYSEASAKMWTDCLIRYVAALHWLLFTPGYSYRTSFDPFWGLLNVRQISPGPLYLFFWFRTRPELYEPKEP